MGGRRILRNPAPIVCPGEFVWQAQDILSVFFCVVPSTAFWNASNV